MTWADRLRRHWPEYAMEAVGLGLFLIVAAAFASLLQHPASPIRRALDPALARRALMGLAMGATAVAIIYSPIGVRSGAHLNPATTLTFLHLGRVHPVDAVGYVVAHVTGGLAGIGVAVALLGPWLAHPAVNYVATVPGPWGAAPAFAAECAMACVLMLAILHASRHPRASRYTGVLAGLLVATFVTLADPLSGASLNPARSLGPALLAGRADALWIYLLAPPIGMRLAAAVFLLQTGAAGRRAGCAKLHHRDDAPCLFCGHAPAAAASAASRVTPRAPRASESPAPVHPIPLAEE